MPTSPKLLEPSLPSQANILPAAQFRRRGAMSIASLYPVLRHVEVSLGSRLRVGDMAAALGLSLFYFSREFLRITGVSPYAYVRRRRISRAALLLAGSKLAINAIAREVGFATQSHFTTAFSRDTGITPSRYRRRYGSRAQDAGFRGTAKPRAPVRVPREYAGEAAD